ncbi:MAG: hypothetical protein E7G71_02235 [Clostridium perfringens]|nr:hypothetical protein [Clostridium perfringens]
MEVYVIRENKIYKGKIVKPSKKGMAAWVKIDSKSKLLLVSYSNCFKTEKEAILELNRINKIKENKEAKFKEDQKEIDDVLGKIYKEFGIEIRLLEGPVLIEEAEELYYNLCKNNKS